MFEQTESWSGAMQGVCKEAETRSVETVESGPTPKVRGPLEKPGNKAPPLFQLTLCLIQQRTARKPGPAGPSCLSLAQVSPPAPTQRRRVLSPWGALRGGPRGNLAKGRRFLSVTVGPETPRTGSQGVGRTVGLGVTFLSIFLLLKAKPHQLFLSTVFYYICH